jgi:outer membrane immunogenic protein
MRRISLAILCAFSTFGIVQLASAADIARPVYKALPPAPLPQDWSGVYVGLEGGYGWGRQSTDATYPGSIFEPVMMTTTLAPVSLYLLSFPDVAIPSTKQNGWLFGGFFGAQKQWGNWVLGIEGDIDGADIKGSGTSTATSHPTISWGTGITEILVCEGPCLSLKHDVSIESKIDMLGSLRGKIGFAPAPDWLIYGTGGAAWAHVKNTITSNESYVEYTDQICLPAFPDPTLSGGTSMFGWAAGAGIDWKWRLDAGSALVFGVEYLHYGFPEQTITLADNNGASFAFTAKENVDVVKGRISYLFSIH